MSFQTVSLYTRAIGIPLDNSYIPCEKFPENVAV